MASITVKFRPSSVADREGTLFYQIIHARKQRQLFTVYHIFQSEWNENRACVTQPLTSERRSHIISIRDRIRWDLERLSKIIRRLESTGVDYTVDDVADEFDRYVSEYSLFNYMESLIMRLRQNGKIRTSETYKAALNSFRRFHRDEDIMLDSLTSETMEDYEAWQKNRGISSNTTSFYARILRAAYKRAVDDEIIEDRNPFRRIYTGVNKTVKRALPLRIIRMIRALDLSLTPQLDFARDMFMMSFMLRGMSFVDMAYLRKKDLADDHVTYRRRKTGQQLTIEWTAEMQMLLDKYPANSSDYLLPIIRKPGGNERCTYRNVGYNINHNLKRIAEMVDIPGPLTLYVARHSWASVARAKGIPVSVISEGMGHDSEATTRIYLASLDTAVVDRANTLILASL